MGQRAPDTAHLLSIRCHECLENVRRQTDSRQEAWFSDSRYSSADTFACSKFGVYTRQKTQAQCARRSPREDLLSAACSGSSNNRERRTPRRGNLTSCGVACGEEKNATFESNTAACRMLCASLEWITQQQMEAATRKIKKPPSRGEEGVGPGGVGVIVIVSVNMLRETPRVLPCSVGAYKFA